MEHDCILTAFGGAGVYGIVLAFLRIRVTI